MLCWKPFCQCFYQSRVVLCIPFLQWCHVAETVQRSPITVFWISTIQAARYKYFMAAISCSIFWLWSNSSKYLTAELLSASLTRKLCGIFYRKGPKCRHSLLSRPIFPPLLMRYNIIRPIFLISLIYRHLPIGMFFLDIFILQYIVLCWLCSNQVYRHESPEKRINLQANP